MNVIWIISDTLRRDHLGAYGNKKIHTPALDTLAAKSVKFNNHYIAAFPTMPTRADFLTGRWTMSYMQWEPLPAGEVVLGEILSRKGIHTAAVVDTPFYIRGGMNYDRGFQTFTEIPGQFHYAGGASVSHRDQPDDVLAQRRFESDCFAPKTFIKAMQWLEYHYKEDFFLCVDTWDPHEAWNAPSYYTEPYWPGYDGEIIKPVYGRWQDAPGYTEEKVKKALATYCGEVTMVDTWAGAFLRQVENMGLMKNTAIIFTTDHGFYFGEHNGLFGKMSFAKDTKTGKEIMGLWTHSPYYQEVTYIPLFIYMPDIPAGTYDGLTSAVDLMPTVLDMMGQKIPPSVEGKSLLPKIKDRNLPGRDYVISGHPFVNAGEIVRSVDDSKRIAELPSEVTITTNEWALLYDPAPGFSELFNVKSDPLQKKNIIAKHPDVARELHQLLVKFMHETNVAADLQKPRLELKL
jgi:arylsulfatase A-like enzyme